MCTFLVNNKLYSPAEMFDSLTFIKLSSIHIYNLHGLPTCQSRTGPMNHRTKLQSPVSQGSWIFRMGPNARKLLASVAASVMSRGISSHENASFSLDLYPPFQETSTDNIAALVKPLFRVAITTVTLFNLQESNITCCFIHTRCYSGHGSSN